MKSPNLYERLSNRSIALILLVGIVAAAYMGIRYVFFLNTGSITFQVLDTSAYHVVLQKSGIAVSELACSKTCTFTDIP